MPEQSDPFDPQVARQNALDNVLSNSSDQIRFHPFEIVRRGYDAQAVRGYLSILASWFDALKARVRVLEERHAIPGDIAGPPPGSAGAPAADAYRADAYEEVAVRVAGVMRAADEYARETRAQAEEQLSRAHDEAERQAERVLDEARERADRIVTSAERTAEDRLAATGEEVQRLEQGAEEALARARAAAEELISELGPRRQSILDELQSLRASLGRLADEVDSHLGSLTESSDLEGFPAADLDAGGMADLDREVEPLGAVEDSTGPIEEVTVVEDSVSFRADGTQPQPETQGL
jgi:hypothetical protein